MISSEVHQEPLKSSDQFMICINYSVVLLLTSLRLPYQLVNISLGLRLNVGNVTGQGNYHQTPILTLRVHHKGSSPALI